MEDANTRPPWKLWICYVDDFKATFEVDGSCSQAYEAAAEFSTYEGVALVRLLGTREGTDVLLSEYVNGHRQEETP